MHVFFIFSRQSGLKQMLICILWNSINALGFCVQNLVILVFRYTVPYSYVWFVTCFCLHFIFFQHKDYHIGYQKLKGHWCPWCWSHLRSVATGLLKMHQSSHKTAAVSSSDFLWIRVVNFASFFFCSWCFHLRSLHRLCCNMIICPKCALAILPNKDLMK